MTSPPPLPRPPSLPLKEARALAARALNRLERAPEALRLAVTGEVRRMQPWVARVDLLATAHAAEPLLDALAAAPFVAQPLERTPAALEVETRDGVRLRLEVVEHEAHFGAALLRSTGPGSYVLALHRLARGRGLAWEGDRLREGGQERGAGEEAEVYAALGLPWQPAERRGRGSLEEGSAPGLLEMRDLLGVAGLHAGRGPGRYGTQELAARAAREGYIWALIESPGGEPERPDAAAIEGLAQPAARRLRIAARGDLEPPAAGAEADAFTLACLAGSAVPDGAGRTDLLVKAARSAHVDVVLLSLPEGTPEEAAALDVPRLLDACAASGVALGLAPPPHHPRPEPGLLEAAAARGVPILLLAEAQDLNSVDDIILSVGLARRAGVPRSLVLNTFDLGGLLAWRALRRERAAHAP